MLHPSHGFSGDRRTRWWLVAAILAAAGLAYLNSLDVPLLFDDVSAITRNSSIRHLTPIVGVLNPPADSTAGGRPLFNLSLALNYAISGEAVLGYHLGNLALHLVNGLWLFGIVRRTWARLAPDPNPGCSPTVLAALSTALWLLHPVQTGAVTYISQRSEVLMAFWYLATLYCAIRRFEGQDTWIWTSAAVVSCALGMMSKEVMVTAPVLVLLYDRAFESGSFQSAWRRHGRLHLSLRQRGPSSGSSSLISTFAELASAWESARLAMHARKPRPWFITFPSPAGRPTWSLTSAPPWNPHPRPSLLRACS